MGKRKRKSETPIISFVLKADEVRNNLEAAVVQTPARTPERSEALKSTYALQELNQLLVEAFHSARKAGQLEVLCPLLGDIREAIGWIRFEGDNAPNDAAAWEGALFGYEMAFSRWLAYADMVCEMRQGAVQEKGSPSRKQPWTDDAPDYLPNSEAIKVAKEMGKEDLTLTALSKILNPNGTIRYMRRGQRCKVHIADFVRHFRSRARDMFSEEAFDKYYAGVEARRKAIGLHKQGGK